MTNPFEELSAQIVHLHDVVHVLSERIRTMPKMVEPDDPIGVKEAAKYLNLSTGAVYQKIDSIPHKKRNGKLYFFKSQLRQYIEEGVV